MLAEIKIENFGIIEQLRLRPGRGLNAITGETGSGKSLVLSAIEAVLGQRTGGGVVRSGAARAVVEALFQDATNAPFLIQALEQRGVPREDNYLSVRREIHREGRSRCFLNGTAVPLAFLRSIGQHLVELHGQHEHQRILDPETHLDALDVFAGTGELRGRVAELYHEYNRACQRLKAVTMESDERDRRLEFLHHAVEELDRFAPRTDEYEELLNEQSLMRNSGRLYADLCTAYGYLREEEQSISDRLAITIQLLERHSDLLPGLDEQIARLCEATYCLEAAGDYLRDQKERLQFSPERQEDVDDRILGYQRLHKKYGGTTSALLETREDYLREIGSIEMSEEERELLESRCQVLRSELMELSEELSRQRRSVIAGLEATVTEEIQNLGMPGARFKIAVRRDMQAERDPDPNTKPAFVLSERGLDRVEFMLGANTGEAIRPLRKVASGGELSRITLALKTVFVQHQPVAAVIFDEVDAGVGGAIAHTIGSRLQGLAERSQVLVVTHLHQIASLADHHFQVQKEIESGRTASRARRLQGEDRIREMARMLGGEESTGAVLEHARQLLARNGKISMAS